MEFNATFTIIILSFVGFMVLMRQIFFEPIRKIKAARQQELTLASQEADDLAVSLSALSEDHKARLAEARQNAQQLVSKMRQDALQTSQAMRDEAKASAQQELASHVDALSASAKQIADELADERAAFATQITQRLQSSSKKPALSAV